MLLGRIILLLQAESHALLKRKWLTKIFVTGDVLSFLLQGAGKYYSARLWYIGQCADLVQVAAFKAVGASKV
jgi:hypothetical protein